MGGLKLDYDLDKGLYFMLKKKFPQETIAKKFHNYEAFMKIDNYLFNLELSKKASMLEVIIYLPDEDYEAKFSALCPDLRENYRKIFKKFDQNSFIRVGKF